MGLLSSVSSVHYSFCHLLGHQAAIFSSLASHTALQYCQQQDFMSNNMPNLAIILCYPL